MSSHITDDEHDVGRGAAMNRAARLAAELAAIAAPQLPPALRCTVYRHTDGKPCAQPLEAHGPLHFPPSSCTCATQAVDDFDSLADARAAALACPVHGGAS